MCVQARLTDLWTLGDVRRSLGGDRRLERAIGEQAVLCYAWKGALSLPFLAVASSRFLPSPQSGYPRWKPLL